jgi:FKBP-type peptidyl-prolyl cis-trans isomerase FklB
MLNGRQVSGFKRAICSVALMTSLTSGHVFSAETASGVLDPSALTDQQQLSYAIGVVFGSRLQKEASELDMALFEQGLKDSYQGLPLLLTDSQIKNAFDRYQQLKEDARNTHLKALEALSDKNFKIGQDFLKQNLSQSSVKELEPGLQYQVITTGEGVKPSATDRVKVHYQGQLINGDVFDSSYERGEPVEFELDQVIPGWTKSVVNMQEGAIWTIWVAPHLAYGAGGAGPIGPNEVLEFKIELIKVNP